MKALGVVAPGMIDWPAARAVLRGEAPYRKEPLPRLAPTSLPATERRRASPAVKLAMAASEQALEGAADTAMAAVFASSEGDTGIFDQICRSLASENPWVSPTRFHNSVHNAPAGYWSIAAHSQRNTSAVSGFDDSFAAGLLEAASWVSVDGLDQCLLVAYDLVPPEPLHAARRIDEPFGVALRLAGQGGADALARLDLELDSEAADITPMEDAGLEALRAVNPAARALPLLWRIALGSGDLALPYYEGALRVRMVNP